MSGRGRSAHAPTRRRRVVVHAVTVAVAIVAGITLADATGHAWSGMLAAGAIVLIVSRVAYVLTARVGSGTAQTGPVPAPVRTALPDQSGREPLVVTVQAAGERPVEVFTALMRRGFTADLAHEVVYDRKGPSVVATGQSSDEADAWRSDLESAGAIVAVDGTASASERR